MGRTAAGRLLSRTGYRSPVLTLTSDPQGGWLEINGPMAASDGSKTYVCYVKDGGDVAVVAYDHASGVTSAETVVASAVEDDLHVTPSLLVGSDGKIAVFYSAHEGPDLWMRVSTNAGDISSFDAAVNLDSQIGAGSYTYISAIELDDAIYLFVRYVSSGTKWGYSVSTDNRASWSTITHLYSNTTHNRAYLKVNGSGNRIDCLGITEHPDNGAGDVEHFYLTSSAGSPSFFDSAGNALTLPITQGEATTVYDGTSAGHRVGLGDVRPGLNVTFSVGVAAGDVRAYWARYASGWDTHEVTDGHAFFSDYLAGGSAFVDANTVLVSKDDGGTMEVYRFVTADNGGTWVSSQLTVGSVLDQVFLKPVKDADALSVVWLNATIGVGTWDAGIRAIR